MPHVVTEACIGCKYTDCVTVCPVDCFYEGENFLVIHPDECIDCGLCVPTCPVAAIKTDDELEGDEEEFLALNEKYAQLWPNITLEKDALPDAEANAKIVKKKHMLITTDRS